MITIHTRHHGTAPVADTLTLDFEHRAKSRFSARLASGKEVALVLPRGQLLRDGDQLKTDEGAVIGIIAAKETVIEARFDSFYDLARAAFHLGNRHVVAEIGKTPETLLLRILPDHVLEHMLLGLGAKLRTVLVPFEPESGAYGHGHHHHEHEHEDTRGHERIAPKPVAKIHEMSKDRSNVAGANI